VLFSIQELAEDMGVTVSGVLHVGAHLAEESDDYERYNWTPIIWVEAQPKIIRQLEQRLNGNIHRIIEAAIWHESGTRLPLYIASNSQSTSLLEFGTHAQVRPDINFVDSIMVTTKRLDHLITKEEMPDFINLDIQGAELSALRSLGSLIARVNHIYMEVNRREVYKGCAHYTEVDAYLKNLGFSRIATRWYFNMGWGEAVYSRKGCQKSFSSKYFLKYCKNNFKFYVRQFRSLIRK